MEIDDVSRGIAVVIDDQIGAGEKDPIDGIIQEMEGMGFIFIKLKDIPPSSTIQKLNNVEFILLDWRLISTPAKSENIPISGSYVPSTLIKEKETQIIKFIKEIDSMGFIPIFIISSLSKTDIIEKLEGNEIDISGKGGNFISVEKKPNPEKILALLSKKIELFPTLYVMKQWESAINIAKQNLFKSFYKLNPNWPKVFYQTYQADKVDPDEEIGNLILYNLISRLENYDFSGLPDIGRKKKVNKEELKKIIEGRTFLDKEYLNPDYSKTGDLYYIDKGKSERKYYLNVQPQCDCKGKKHNLIFIKGREIKEQSDLYNKKTKSVLMDKVCQHKVFFIYGGKIIDFSFRSVEIKQFNSKLVESRVGRILPPIITNICKRFSYYLMREGTPRIPDEVF